MGNRNHEFVDDDWSEYKKTSKKKVKHREHSESWKFNPRKDYTMDENDDYEDDYGGKARNR